MMLTAVRSRSASLRRQIAARGLVPSSPLWGRSARDVAADARIAVSRRFASARSNTLTLVAVNDVYDLEHLPKLRTLVDAVKAQREGTVITTLAGDFLSPSVLSSLDRGRGMVGAVRESKAPSCRISRRSPRHLHISVHRSRC